MKPLFDFFHNLVGREGGRNEFTSVEETSNAFANKKLKTKFDSFVKQGQKFQEQQQWSASAGKYRSALKLSRSLNVEILLAEVLTEAGLMADARKIVNNISESCASNSSYLSRLARVMAKLGAKWEAFILFDYSYQLDSSKETSKEIEHLIGTTSSYSDIDAAMRELFDEKYYLAQYSDVRGATAKANVHYLLYGWKEDRRPSAFFDPIYYGKRAALDKGDFPLAHYLAIGRQAGLHQNPIGDRQWFVPKAPALSDWDDVEPALLTELTRAVVILPVYKGYDETLSSVYSALKSRQGEPYSLLVSNDCGPDEELNATLAELAKRGLFDYHYSWVNKGFVQTVNYAISDLSRELDVILLNSDAYVFPGWFSRMVAHADADPMVATITPLSNNATICSYPVNDSDNRIALNCSPAELDKLASHANAGVSVETPTGVGFCFYMRRSVINHIGVLDAVAFEVGYGEENDFCMRALGEGYKNLIACDIFVFHVGSVSFSATKEINFSKGQIALNHKHPNYQSAVKNFMLSNPPLASRRRLDASRLALNFSGCVVILSHRWQGGVNTYLDTVKRDLLSNNISFISLIVHDLCYVSIETSDDAWEFVPNLSDIDLRTEWELFDQILKTIKPSLFHVNSFAGLDWLFESKIMNYLAAERMSFKYIVHDYMAISHHYQLLRPDNCYVGIPSLEELYRWGSMKVQGIYNQCDPLERISAYKKFLSLAKSIEAPSETAKSIIQCEFPDISITVVPHVDHLPDLPVARLRKRDGELRIMIVGAIGPHKGSDVLAALAADAASRGLKIQYWLVGYSNQDEMLIANGVKVTGSYKKEVEAAKQIVEIAPDLIFIPSIWPETFCYTLSFALKMGVPTVVFDLGAQAERTRKMKTGVRLPVSYINNPSELNRYLLSLDIEKLWETLGGSFEKSD